MDHLQLTVLESTGITRWDFDALKAELGRRLQAHEVIACTDENIRLVKADRTELSRAKKVIEDARRAYKSKCLEPYEALEPRIKELTDIIDRQRAVIDNAVKEYEARQKEEKQREIRQYYDRKASELGEYADALWEKLFDPKWANASTARSKYEVAVIAAVDRAKRDMDTIRATGSPFTKTLLEEYVRTLSLEVALGKNEELTQAAKAAGLADAGLADAAPTEAAEPPKVTQKFSGVEGGIILKIHASDRQLEQLCDFMTAIGVSYERL